MFRLSLVPTLLCFLSTVPVGAVSPDNPVYVSCFNTSLAGMITHTLSWEHCVRYCGHKLTKYVAIQTDPSAPSFNLFFCIDDLPSLTANGSLCQHCHDQEDKVCGGQDGVSVYQLRESTPFAVFLATDTVVNMFVKDGQNSNVSTLVESGITGIVGLDYSYTDDLIVIYSRNVIMSSYYDKYVSMKYENASIVRHDYYESLDKEGLAIDGKPGQIYFKLSHSERINIFNLHKHDVTNSEVDVSTFAAMAIDSKNRLLFYIGNEQMFSFNLVTRRTHEFKTGKKQIKNVAKVAVDTERKLVYLLELRDQYYITAVDYNDTNKKAILSGPTLTDPSSFDVFNGVLVWVNAHDSSYTLYRCKLAPSCLQKNVEVLFTTTEVIKDIRIYNPGMQEEVYYCKMFNCSHSCNKTSLPILCTCPEGMELGSDNRTCHDTSKTAMNATYVGCFSTASVADNGYQYPQPLTWDQAVHFCAHRLIQYAAIHPDPSHALDNLVICGDYTLDDLTAVNNSFCLPCHEDILHYCGGDNVSAVYKTRDTMPPVIILGMATGVKMFGVTLEVVANTSTPVTSVAYDFAEDQIFFISQEQIWSTYYSSFLSKYIPHQIGGVGGSSVVTVDWIYKKLYWTARFSPHYSSAYYSRTYGSDLQGNDISEISNFKCDRTGDIPIDAFRRMLWYICGKTLYMYSLTNGPLIPYDLKAIRLKKVLDVTVDVGQETIYMIGTEDGEKLCLFSLNYQNRKSRVLLCGQELAESFGISAFKDEVIWGTKNGEQYLLYSCRLTPKCRRHDLTVAYQTEERIYSFKIFHPQAQPPLTLDCKTAGCSHKCTASKTFGTTCTCPETMLLADDKKRCIDAEKSKMNATYVGCFTTASVTQTGYQYSKPLSWDQAVHFCAHRLMQYAAVYPDPSHPADNLVICGDYTLENLTAVNSSLCRPCHDDVHQCGGNGTSSLYKIRDTTPRVLLLGTATGVKMFAGTIEDIANISKPVTSVAYHYSEDEILFISQKQIFSSYYSPFLKRYVPPAVVVGYMYNPTVVTVDWLYKKLYWVSARESRYSLHYEVVESDLRGENSSVLRDTETYRRLADIEVDAFSRQIVYINDSVLYTYSMADHHLTHYDGKEIQLKKVLKMTVDVGRGTIYIIGTEDDEKVYLISVEFQDRNPRMLFSGPELTEPFGLAAINNEVIWGNKQDDKYFLYSCRLTPKCRHDDLTVIYRTEEAIYDVRVYHPDVQPLLSENICKRAGCSHSCTNSPQSGLQCTCPKTMVLAPDNNSCIERSPSPVVPLEMKTSVSVTTTGPTDVVTWSVTPPKMFIKRKTTLKKNPSSEDSTKRSLELEVTEVSENETSSMMPSTEVPQSPCETSTMHTTEILIIIGVVIIIGFQIGLVYFYGRRRSNSRFLANSYRQSSEAKELTSFN